VPPQLRGKYRAFCPQHIEAARAAASDAGARAASDAPPAGSASHGLAHLRALAEAGLTHVHLLPSYDFGSVPEREEEQEEVEVRGGWSPPPLWAVCRQTALRKTARATGLETSEMNQHARTPTKPKHTHTQA
jgi:hypothetical protein